MFTQVFELLRLKASEIKAVKDDLRQFCIGLVEYAEKQWREGDLGKSKYYFCSLLVFGNWLPVLYIPLTLMSTPCHISRVKEFMMSPYFAAISFRNCLHIQDF